MNEDKKNLIIKILVALAVIGGLVFVYLKKQQAVKKAQIGQQTEENKPPPLLKESKTFQITEAGRNFYKTKDESGKATVILIPKGVIPNLVDIKEAKAGYYVELFSYRPVADAVIAHSLNVTAADPHKQFSPTFASPEKTIGGIVVEINKTTFKINNLQPGGTSKIYEIIVLPNTIFTKLDIVKTTQETKTSFSSLALDQSVAVHYTQNSEELKAQKVDILWNYQLPIVQAPKQ